MNFLLGPSQAAFARNQARRIAGQLPGGAASSVLTDELRETKANQTRRARKPRDQRDKSNKLDYPSPGMEVNRLTPNAVTKST